VFDVLVLGSGVAGLTTALEAARHGMSVVVVTKGELWHSATRYAQGGVAAAFAAPDSPELHLEDTLRAGAGLCDVDAVRVLVTEGPDRVRDLAELGARFDVDRDDGSGHLALAREGGHSLARVVHAGGDATGAEIERALVAAVLASAIEVREAWFATRLEREGRRCTGVTALRPDGSLDVVRANNVVLATGGTGQCFAVTTNPTLSTGDGIALALAAGVACADLEFVQFHPTALHHPSMPRPLLSEALRGEGAVLRDAHGERFMSAVHPLADLAPRDVVARAIYNRMQDQGTDHVWLDATMIDDFATHFPTIWRACRTVGLDPTRDWLPVAPAAHYMSGGAVTDLDGATTLPHLWACGETACSGVHGANRLASNSLLDGLVFGRRVVAAIATGKREAEPTGAMAGVLDVELAPTADAGARPHGDGSVEVAELRGEVQRTMSDDCGVVRDATSLKLAAEALDDIAARATALTGVSIGDHELFDIVHVSRAIVDAATARQESRGSHTRREFPTSSEAFLGRFVVAGGAEPTFVPMPAHALRGQP
jgi:L-aspartate oxidase